MTSFRSRPKTLSASSLVSRKRRTRFSGKVLVGFSVTFALVLLAGAAFAFQTLAPSHAASVIQRSHHAQALTTINKLTHISQVGSTANILSAQGKPLTVDPNPYKIAIAPTNLSPNLQAGDILVSNI